MDGVVPVAHPERAEYAEFTVQHVRRPGGTDHYEVRVKDTLAYLFKDHTGAPNPAPGWLRDLHFSSFEQAVLWGENRLAPWVRVAHKAHGEMSFATARVIEAIEAERSLRTGEPG